MSKPNPDPTKNMPPSPPRENLYIIGFSGTGKTVSGSMAADRLGWDFVDTDSLVEQRAGKQIPQIFAEDGEERFRQIESGALLDVSEGSRQVIATGGGMPVNSLNRDVMRRTGLTVRLIASPETISIRLSGGRSKRTRALRPLLGDAPEVERIRKLLESREAAYSQADVTIQTDGREHAEVATSIADAWRQFKHRKQHE